MQEAHGISTSNGGKGGVQTAWWWQIATIRFFATGFAIYIRDNLFYILAQIIYSRTDVSKCNALTIDWQNSSQGVLQNGTHYMADAWQIMTNQT